MRWLDAAPRRAAPKGHKTFILRAACTSSHRLLQRRLLSAPVAQNAVKLTAWGQLLQGLLRLTGPVLLGLALLALRGRVRRQGSGGIRKGTRGAQRRPGAGGPSGKLEGFCLAGDPRRRRGRPRTRSSRSPRRRGLGPRRSLAPRQDECRSAGRRPPELPG